jgi:hypothetical protein
MFRSAVATASCSISGLAICKEGIEFCQGSHRCKISSWVLAEFRGYRGLHCIGRSRLCIPDGLQASESSKRIRPKTKCSAILASRGRISGTCISLRHACSARRLSIFVTRPRNFLVRSVASVQESSRPSYQESTSSQDDSFLSDESFTWRSLGLSAEVSDALLRANLLQPSLVQVLHHASLRNPAETC